MASNARFAHSRWGLLARDTHTGAEAHPINADQFFIPGSNAKLFSVGAAWNALGADYQFQTPVYRLGTAAAGVLRGNLVLVASGDLTMGGRTKPDGTVDFRNFDHNDANALPGLFPAEQLLTSEDPLAGLDELAKDVRGSGISRVDGDIVVDDRLFETDREQNPETPVWPVIINDNLIDLVVTPAASRDAPATVTSTPKTGALEIRSTVTTGAADSAVELRSAIDGRTLTVSGTVPAGHSPVLRIQQIPNPPSFARVAFIEALERAGVHVTAPADAPNRIDLLPAAGSYRNDELVATLRSPPFSEYGKLILKVSHNLGANLCVCLLAVKSGSRSCLDGLATERLFLQQARVDPAGAVLGDGQGISTTDLVTPRAVVGLLTYFAARPDFARWKAALPVMGQDGSLARMLPRSPAARHVFAKTGTLISGDLLNARALLSVNAIAGYIDTSDRRSLAFALYVNNVPMSDPATELFAVNDTLGSIAAILWGEAAR